MALPRGAVITGMVRDPHGDPAPGITVAVLSRRFAPPSGEQRLVPVPGTNVTTDDRGSIGSLASRQVPTWSRRYPASHLPARPASLRAVSREEIQRALAEVQETPHVQPLWHARRQHRTGRPAPVRRPVCRTRPTYFPGTTSESRATAITVTAGEVRTGSTSISITSRLVSVEGFVATPSESRVAAGALEGGP